MDRYDFSVTEPTFIGDDGLVQTKCDDGIFVYYDDAQAEIARLTDELRDARKVHDQIIGERYNNLVRAEKAEIDAEFFKSEVKLRNRIESTNDTAASLQRKYEETLARAAAAAMDMRKRAAATYAMYSGVDLTKRLTSLPIDPDAQQALDKMLAQAREDAIREAASIGYVACAEARHITLGDKVTDRILALLNDGGRNV